MASAEKVRSHLKLMISRIERLKRTDQIMANRWLAVWRLACRVPKEILFGHDDSFSLSIFTLMSIRVNVLFYSRQM